MEILSAKDRATLLSVARMTLQTYVKTLRMPDLELSSPGVCQRLGASVILTTLGVTRGSATRADPRAPLYRTIMDLTASAADDESAPRIEADELHQTVITISVLGIPAVLRSSDEIIVGGTGLLVRDHPGWLTLPEPGSPLTPEAQITSALRAAGFGMEDWPGRVEILRFDTDQFSEDVI